MKERSKDGVMPSAGVDSPALPGAGTLTRLTENYFHPGQALDPARNGSAVPEQGLLEILCCPETHQALAPASPEIMEQLNQRVFAGTLRNRRGQAVRERLDGGLVRADGRFVYPIRQNIPVMLVDEAIPL